uniref:G-protein coupled receptors family 1 profile domain-containing protein n=1 Tax=Astyanax mexicanus TaxID=7994 RepID=W5LS31_ASTMX
MSRHTKLSAREKQNHKLLIKLHSLSALEHFPAVFTACYRLLLSLNMNTAQRYQAACTNLSLSSHNGTQPLLPWRPDVASCHFWNIVHNNVLSHVSILLICTFFLFSLVVNVYLLLGLEHSEALSWQPRYMLLRNLIVSDLLQTLTLAPSMLYCLFYRQTLSFSGWCLVQFFTATLAIITSLLTVASMALERFVYTCYGIHYLAIMTNGRMYLFLAFNWLLALMGASTSTILVLTGGATFGHVISGFVCEPEVIQAHIRCSLHFETFNKAFVGCLLIFCLLVFTFSYGRMYQEARHAQEPFQEDNIRARGTVAFYLGIFFLQLFPSTIKFITFFDKDMDSHLMMAVVVLLPPCVNPLAYGIRNVEVRQALERLWGLRKLKEKFFH